MSVMDRLASSLGRNDEVPNQALAQELCRTGDFTAIGELVQCLFQGSKAIQSDCIKVLYEIGEVRPELIAAYGEDFLTLLKSKNNRLVWGAMTALAAIAPLKADQIFEQIDLVMETIQHGSVITGDNGISVLAKVGSAGAAYEKKILPFLLHHLASCIPREVAQHVERSMVIMSPDNKGKFQAVLMERFPDLTGSQQTRIKRVIKRLEQL